MEMASQLSPGEEVLDELLLPVTQVSSSVNLGNDGKSFESLVADLRD